MNSKIQTFDVVQSAPKVSVPPVEETTGPEPIRRIRRNYFRPAANQPARLFAGRALGQSVSSAAARAPAAELFRHRLSTTAARCAICSSMSGAFAAAPHAMATFGNVMHRTIKEFVAEVRERAQGSVRRSPDDLRSRMVSARLHRRISRRGISQGRPRPTRILSPDLQRGSRRCDLSGKDLRVGAGRRRGRHRAHGSGQSHRRKTRSKSSITKPESRKTRNRRRRICSSAFTRWRRAKSSISTRPAWFSTI